MRGPALPSHLGRSSSSSSPSPPSSANIDPQAAPLRSAVPPTSYRAHGSTPRSSVSQPRQQSKARSSYSQYHDEQDSTSTDDFLLDDDEDVDDHYDRDSGSRRPFLPKRSISSSSSGRHRRPSSKRSNSIKMQRSSRTDVREAFMDDETIKTSAVGDDHVRLSTSSPTDSPARSGHGCRGGGEGTKSPQSLTFDDVFDPTKTLHENKSMMISAELDRMGMGKYQICIWFLCGCGYFIDLLWAQALGLIVTQVAFEFDDEINGQTGPLSTAFSAGLTAGAFFFGLAVDVVGRKWSFYLTTFIAGVFGIASGGAKSFDTLCVLAAFIGFGIGGNIPIDATITLEFLPTNRRFLVAALSIFQPLGVLVCCGIAYGLVPRYACDSAETCTRSNNMGWRYTLYTLGCITWLIFVARFFIFSFRESPQYLLARGKDEKALEVIRKINKTNGDKTPLLFDMSDFREAAKRIAAHEGREYVEADDQQGLTGVSKHVSRAASFKRSAREMLALFLNSKVLFQNRIMARVTIIIWITFIADFWGFTLAGYYLPQILRAKGAEEDLSIATTYRNYILIYFPGIFAVAFGAAMIEVPKFGRQWAMIFSSALMAVCMFLFTIVETQTGSILANVGEYFFQSFFNSILYAFVPEIYPSQVRGTASGLASTLGRVASIVAPLAADPLYRDKTEEQARHVLYLAGSLTLLCPIALIFLPYDTRGMRVY
ncbi:MFS general substrate transporter [Testicularia cyperi]|uniref:MFS general substrate transporter n=1 Tax=Testicularia cyperi TaxID=1882483 RepID=A0A317XZK6_9BASI|nr:MFS general substrate transporter [Testicularia cyperi]